MNKLVDWVESVFKCEDTARLYTLFFHFIQVSSIASCLGVLLVNSALAEVLPIEVNSLSTAYSQIDGPNSVLRSQIKAAGRFSKHFSLGVMSEVGFTEQGMKLTPALVATLHQNEGGLLETELRLYTESVMLFQISQSEFSNPDFKFYSMLAGRHFFNGANAYSIMPAVTHKISKTFELGLYFNLNGFSPAKPIPNLRTTSFEVGPTAVLFKKKNFLLMPTLGFDLADPNHSASFSLILRAQLR